MISINEHIRFLLTCHDCVVVPGLGAFIAQSEPARFDGQTGIFMPPTRSLGFNPRVSYDDGLLAASVVRREGVSYETARTLIANDVAMLRSRLDSSGMAILPRLGRLDRTGGALLFEPDVDASVASSRYLGLAPLRLDAVPAAAVAAEESAERVMPVDFASRRRLRWVRVAASVAVLLGLGFALSTPVLVDRSELEYAAVSTPKVIRPAAPVRITPVAEGSRSLFCAIPDSATATAQVSIDKLPEKDYTHYLIVASCKTRRRAERYVSTHPADRLRVLDGEGRYRVYIQASDSEEDLQPSRRALADRYPGIWIYSR